MTMDLAANFEELMQRSPIPQHEMKTFLKEMRRTSSGTVTVSKLLAAKIQSSSEAQAIHAFEFLEAALESETEGSIEFRTEIGRYRFLNEIIRILSPKYLGEKTPEAVKERAIQFLEDASGPKRKRWFPSEHSKVNSVYQSLVDGGIIQKPSKVADEDAEFQKSIFERGENAVILKRLLQSKDPSDLQAANRLIKNLVDEEARRNERRAELHSLIDRIETSTGLLTEMLTQPNIDKEIVEELVDTCGSLRQKLGGVATETNDETTSLLQASENIETVLLLYDSKKEYIGKLSKSHETESTASASSSAAYSSSAGAAGSISEFSLADQLLMSLGDEQINGVIKQQSQQAKPAPIIRTNDSENLLLNLDIDLSPVSSIHHKSVTAEMEGKKAESVEPFDEISKLSREMMEQGLKGMSNSSQSKKTDKTPLSQIKKPSQEGQTPTQQQQLLLKTLPTIQPLTPQNSLADPVSLLDLDFLDKPSSSLSSSEKPSLVKASSSSSSYSSNLNTQNTNTDNPATKSTSQAKSSRLKSSSNEEENLLLVLASENPSLVDNNNRNTNNNDNVTASEEEIIEESSSTKTTIPTSAVNGLDGDGESSKFCLKNVKELDLENIDLLDDVKPIELNLNEGNSKDVSLTLTFGKFPSFPSFVNVVVVTLTNKSRTTGLLNYVFQLMPPKGLQVKLLPPACMELPPWKKTFLPPPILTQVALIVIPKSNAVVKTQMQPKIKFILSYCAEDETTLHNGDFSLPSCLVQ